MLRKIIYFVSTKLIQLTTYMIPQYSLCILPMVAIRHWWVILPILLLLAIAIQIWILLETRRMKDKIEQILDQTAMTGGLDEALADAESAASRDDEGPDLDVPIPDTPTGAKNSEDIWQHGKKISKLDRELLARIDAEIEANIQDSEYSIETLRMKLGISRSGLYKKLIYLTGRSPLEYLRIKRLQMGRAMLENGETSVSQIAWSVGFSPKQFSKYFKDEYGCLPSEFIHYISD